MAENKFPNDFWHNEVEHTVCNVQNVDIQYYDVTLTADSGYTFNIEDMPLLVSDGLYDSDEYSDGVKAKRFKYVDATTCQLLHLHKRDGSQKLSTYIRGTVVPDSGGGTITNNVPNSTDKSTWDDIREIWYLQLVANDGYKFKGDIKASYINIDGETQNVTLEARNNTNVWLYVYDADETTEFTITGETESDNEINVTNNVENATSIGEKVGMYGGKVTLTANDGFKITSAKVGFIDGYGHPSKEDMTISADGKTATWSNDDFETDDGVTISGETVSDGAGEPEVTVINNMTGTLNETHTYTDSTLNITVESEHYSSFRFIDPKATYKSVDGESKTVDMLVTVGSDGSVATITITDADPNNPVTLTGRFVDVVDIIQTLTNCTVETPIPEYVESGVPYTLKVTLIANDNTEFSTDNIPIFLYMDESGHPNKKVFTISEDKKTATGEIDLGEWQEITIEAEANPVEVVGQQHGAINVYLVTLDELEQFSAKRFVEGKEVDGTVIYETIDLGAYVNRIRRVYTNIDAVSPDVIRCGNYNTGVTCLQPNTDKITLDFGTAKVPAHNEDNTDYESEIQVFLPFAGFVNLNNDYAGKTISLQYVINVITGNGVAKFSCNGVVFQVEDIKPSSEIIYLSPSDTVKTIGGDEWNEMLYYGLEPYIYCKWYEGVNSGRNNDIHTCVISDLTGFNIFDDVTPIHAPEMLTEEQELIYRALSDGVYI